MRKNQILQWAAITAISSLPTWTLAQSADTPAEAIVTVVPEDQPVMPADSGNGPLKAGRSYMGFAFGGTPPMGKLSYNGQTSDKLQRTGFSGNFSGGHFLIDGLAIDGGIQTVSAASKGNVRELVNRLNITTFFVGPKYFVDTGSPISPYGGIAFAFSKANSDLKSKASVLFSVGADYNLSDNISLGVDVSYQPLKLKPKGTPYELKLNPLYVLVGGKIRF